MENIRLRQEMQDRSVILNIFQNKGQANEFYFFINLSTNAVRLKEQNLSWVNNQNKMFQGSENIGSGGTRYFLLWPYRNFLNMKVKVQTFFLFTEQTNQISSCVHYKLNIKSLKMTIINEWCSQNKLHKHYPCWKMRMEDLLRYPCCKTKYILPCVFLYCFNALKCIFLVVHKSYHLSYGMY